MTKKHFISLADHIKTEPVLQLLNKEQIESLADFCEEQNPRFNRERWLAYIAGECGPNGGSVKPKTEHRPYQPKTGQRCHCKPGIQRDNCPECEGTGQRIDFAAIRNRS